LFAALCKSHPDEASMFVCPNLWCGIKGDGTSQYCTDNKEFLFVNFHRCYWRVALYRVMSGFECICPVCFKDRRSGLELVSES